MMMRIDCCRDLPIETILALPDVHECVELYFEQAQAFNAQLARVAVVHDHLVVLDLRGEAIIHAGNRFLIYAQFPQCDRSMHVLWGRERMNTVYTVGKSIFGGRSAVGVGELLLRHGGGHLPRSERNR